MNEATVKCGCGRTMHLDGRAGRGAYRCGCGARVQITIPTQKTAGPGCVGAYDGEPCRMVATITRPFPLCVEHYRTSGLQEYHGWVRGTPDDIRHAISDLANQRTREAMDKLRADHGVQRLEGHIVPLDAEPIVYFIRSRDIVKIGTTINLAKRLKALNLPELTVLATEPGYYKRERQLHRRFASLQIEREWYRLEGALLDHINAIRARHNLPEVAI